MKNDRILIVGIIGAFSTIPAEIITWIGKLFGFATYSDYQLSSLIVTSTRPSMFLGFIVQGSVGAVVAILLYRVLVDMGEGHILIKSTMIGVVSWVALEILTTAIIEGKTVPLREMSGYYTHFLGSVGFGLTQGWLLKRYMVRKVNT
ncbi:MAG TPA: hypothetical protein VF941_17145 [Clostridia bacterium]